MPLITKLILLAASLLIVACKPQDSGEWKDISVSWSRRWGTGAVGSFSTIGLYWKNGTQIVKGPEIGDNDLEVRRTKSVNGKTIIELYPGTRKVVYALDSHSSGGLTPFTFVSYNDQTDRMIISDHWVGTMFALDLKQGMTEFPK